jgi:hypothetical protein
MRGAGPALRREPGNGRRVWLADAAGCGLLLLIIGAATGKLIAGLTGAIIAFTARRVIESLWLGKRGDARIAPARPRTRQQDPRTRPAEKGVVPAAMLEWRRRV